MSRSFYLHADLASFERLNNCVGKLFSQLETSSSSSPQQQQQRCGCKVLLNGRPLVPYTPERVDFYSIRQAFYGHLTIGCTITFYDPLCVCVCVKSGSSLNLKRVDRHEIKSSESERDSLSVLILSAAAP